MASDYLGDNMISGQQQQVNSIAQQLQFPVAVTAAAEEKSNFIEAKQTKINNEMKMKAEKLTKKHIKFIMA